MTTRIADGTYFLHPDGCGWIAASFRGGHESGRTLESLAATHAAANDRWAGVVPGETDVILSPEDAETIAREVLGEDVCVDRVVVTVATQ